MGWQERQFQNDYNLQQELRRLHQEGRTPAPELLFENLPLSSTIPIVRSRNGHLVAAVPHQEPVVFGFTEPDLLHIPQPRILEQQGILKATLRGLEDLFAQEADLLPLIQQRGAIIDVHAHTVIHPITEVFLGFSPATCVLPDGSLRANHGTTATVPILEGFVVDRLTSDFRLKQHQQLILDIQKRMRAPNARPKRRWW